MAQRRFDMHPGMRFGRLVVLRFDPSKRKRSWLCRCDCGVEVSVCTGGLTGGNNKSCGCLHRDTAALMTYRHGLFSKKMNALVEATAYQSAKQRCINPSNPSYSDYGGRGIEFRFRNFGEFLRHIGRRPTKYHQLDRIDNDGHYEVGNVRWATREENLANRFRRCVFCGNAPDVYARIATFAGWGMSEDVAVGLNPEMRCA